MYFREGLVKPVASLESFRKEKNEETFLSSTIYPDSWKVKSMFN